jgi:hypothetical protein
MTKEFITKAHYPNQDIGEILRTHRSSYGLCSECSTSYKYVPYPCQVIQEIGIPEKTISDIIKEIAETELEHQQTSNTQTEGGCECQTSQN